MRCLLGAALAALASLASAATLEGQAIYRERVGLPLDAVFEAVLEDASRADAPAVTLGRARLDPAGLPPFKFAIEYDPQALKPEGRYQVRATVSRAGQLLHTTDRAYPVLGENAAPLVVLLVSARGVPLRIAPMPATFVGELPAADGPAVRWQLDLLDGARYQLRRSFVGRPEPNAFDAIGRVVRDRGGRRLRLVGTQGADEWFDVIDARTLRKLDMQGRPIESTQPDRLERVDPPEPIDPRLALTGMFVYLADAPRITLCADGRNLPVAMEGDYLALERAYTAARINPGQTLLVELDGQLVPREAGEPGRSVTSLVVERFGALWPRESCGQPLASSPLRNTYWRLTRLDGQPVATVEQKREPHLVLQANEKRVAGSGGCNRLIGSYEQDGEKLSFGRVATTMMACPDGMEQERLFIGALERVQAHRIRGSHLDLLDAAGAVVARLEAVARR
jgi:copper homeostasis protein (lipoprotein)